MSDTNSSEQTTTLNDDVFSQQGLKSFGGGNGAAPASPFPPDPTSPAESTKGPALVLHSRNDENQLKEAALIPFDFFKQIVFGFFPELQSQPEDPATIKAKKEKHLQALSQLNQEQQQIFLQQARVRQEKKDRQAQAAQLKRDQQAAREASSVTAPSGKKSGAFDPQSNSQKTNTADLLKRQRTANSDRTQGAD